MTPLMCSYTACGPQKQPPASTIVCKPLPAGGAGSSAGAGMTTAGSAACAGIVAARPNNDTNSVAHASARGERPRPSPAPGHVLSAIGFLHVLLAARCPRIVPLGH